MAGLDLTDAQMRRQQRPAQQQQHGEGNGTSGHHVRSTSQTGLGGATGVRRSQTYAATAAKARLAQVMARSNVSDEVEDEDEDDDDQNSGPFGFNSDPPLSVPRFGGGTPRDSLPRDRDRDQSPRVRSPYDEALGVTRGGPATNSNLQSVRPVSSGRPMPPQRNLSSHRQGSLPLPAGFPGPVVPSLSSKKISLEPTIPRADPIRSNGVRRGEDSLRDEIDWLQEDNQSLLSKLRAAEEKLQEKDLRNKELERQIASFGDGISLEAKLLSKKDAALKQREAALLATNEKLKDMKDDEIAALRLEADTARDELESASQRASVAEKEVQGLRTVTRRMVLTEDEMEEMVLKRCWLARYWGLASRHSVFGEVAASKHERWSAVAPLPLEVVISAGHSDGSNGDAARLNKITPAIRDLNDITGEGNVECMLAVEKGLRELALLNVEQAVMLAMAQNHRHLSLDRSELSVEEIEDIQFKHAWLVYFWRRAKNLNVEKDIADERLTYWMTRSNLPPSSHDVVDVERGLLELHKMGIEEQLWEASRREVALAPSSAPAS